MLDLELLAVCDFSVTNVCNAACDFCGFAREKTLTGPARYVDADAFSRALPILNRRGIRYVTLQGGEPLVHPDIVRLVSQTAAAGMSCAIITNGWFLPRYIGSLMAAGLEQLIVSIDSAELAEHERNRGLEGLERRLAEGIGRTRARGLSVQASVTVSRCGGSFASRWSDRAGPRKPAGSLGNLRKITKVGLLLVAIRGGWM